MSCPTLSCVSLTGSSATQHVCVCHLWRRPPKNRRSTWCMQSWMGFALLFFRQRLVWCKRYYAREHKITHKNQSYSVQTIGLDSFFDKEEEWTVMFGFKFQECLWVIRIANAGLRSGSRKTIISHVLAAKNQRFRCIDPLARFLPIKFHLTPATSAYQVHGSSGSTYRLLLSPSPGVILTLCECHII